MLIGIITFWQTRDNYGQILQCYALQYILKRLGHNPFLIRYTHSEVKLINNRQRLKLLINKLFSPGHTKTQIRQKKPSSDIREFEKFKQKYISMGDTTYHSINELRKDPPVADAYIVGSDQVWSKSLAFEENKAFFLDFGSKRIKRVSYAASFAKNKYEDKYKRSLKRLLKAFDNISVREKSGVSICQEVGYDAHLVLDPTLLLNFNIYSSEFNISHRHKNQIYVYALNIQSPEDIFWGSINQYADKEKLSIIVTTSSGYINSSKIFGDIKYNNPTIPKWLENISSSSLVVTTSFHGIVFCLLSHTPFLYVPLKGLWSQGNNRVLDLLGALGLSDRAISDDHDFVCKSQSIINWEEIDDRLMILRENSIDFLKMSLQ